MDLCVCMYEADDPGVGDLLSVLMTTTIMLIEVRVITFQIFDNGN